MMRATLVILSSLLLGACSMESFQRAGANIMESIGLGAEETEHNSTEASIAAATDPKPEEEYYLGRAVAARILARYKTVDREALNEYLGLALAANAAFSPRPTTFGGYHVALLDTDEVNALSAPGGFVFVSRGMLSLLENEEALAAVLAHELAHVALKHGTKAISAAHLRESASQKGNLGAAAAASLSCGVLLEGAALVFGAAVDDMVTTLLEKGYSRDQEIEADVLAAKILASAGYRTHGLVEVLKALEKREGSGGGWFATHPGARDRLEVLEKSGALAQAEPDAAAAAKRARRFHAALADRAPEPPHGARQGKKS